LNVNAKPTTPAVDIELRPLIAEARELWATVKSSRLDLGRQFAKLKNTLAKHKKQLPTGQGGTDAVSETNARYSASDFCRQMAVARRTEDPKSMDHGAKLK
jgi:type IV secretory pathway TrbL component